MLRRVGIARRRVRFARSICRACSLRARQFVTHHVTSPPSFTGLRKAYSITSSAITCPDCKNHVTLLVLIRSNSVNMPLQRFLSLAVIILALASIPGGTRADPVANFYRNKDLRLIIAASIG